MTIQDDEDFLWLQSKLAQEPEPGIKYHDWQPGPEQGFETCSGCGFRQRIGTDERWLGTECIPTKVVDKIHNDYNQFNNHPSILQATALKIEEGLMPYRYVLRNLASGVSPFVVHRENLKLVDGVWEHSEFYWGHYFRELAEAEKFFQERNHDDGRKPREWLDIT